MPYPVIIPVPNTVDNPLVTTVPAFYPTAFSNYAPDGPALGNVMPVMAWLDESEAVDLDLCQFQTINASVALYSQPGGMGSGDRNRWQSHLPGYLYGASSADTYPFIEWASIDTIPSWAPDGDYWGILFVGNESGEWSSGISTITAPLWAYTCWVFAKAWLTLQDEGSIDGTYTWLSNPGDPTLPGSNCILLYGPEPEDQGDWQTATATALATMMQITLPNLEFGP